MIQHGWNILLWNEWRERGEKIFWLAIPESSASTGLYTHLSPRSYSFYSAVCVPFIRITCIGSVCVCRSSSWCKMGGRKKNTNPRKREKKKKQQQNQTAATLPTPGSRSGFFSPSPGPTAIKCYVDCIKIYIYMYINQCGSNNSPQKK